MNTNPRSTGAQKLSAAALVVIAISALFGVYLLWKLVTCLCPACQQVNLVQPTASLTATLASPTSVSPTATEMTATATTVPVTPVPPTATRKPCKKNCGPQPTVTIVPSNTPVPPTNTVVPPTKTTVPPTSTPNPCKDKDDCGTPRPTGTPNPCKDDCKPPKPEATKANCGVGQPTTDGDTKGCPNGSKDGSDYGQGHPGAQGGNGNPHNVPTQVSGDSSTPAPQATEVKKNDKNDSPAATSCPDATTAPSTDGNKGKGKGKGH